MNESAFRPRILNEDPPIRSSRVRFAVFLVVFAVAAGIGLAYDYSRPAVYRASARLSVEPPGVDDAAAKAQFAVSEALALRTSEILTVVAQAAGVPASDLATASGEHRLAAEAIPQTSVIELRADGADRERSVTLLSAWIDAYQTSRRQTDRAGEADAGAAARHAVAVAEKSVATKRQEIEAFQKRHGIASLEREENPGAARLKGVHAALNDASAKEVAAEAKLKSIDQSLASGKGFVRTADRATIANLEMRAVDLREKMKDLEHDFTAQYLALDPKYKALRANLQRLEQQIEKEKQRSSSTAKVEAQEEYDSAQRAAETLKEQAEALQKDTHAFSVRFLDLKRLSADLEQLQENRREAVARLQRIESARQPAAVRVQVLSAPAAGLEPIDPPYSRDAAIVLAAALAMAIGAVWLGDYLLRQPRPPEPPVQPIIQIAYPALGEQTVDPSPRTALTPPPSPRLAAPVAAQFAELSVGEVGALWNNADHQCRLIIALAFSGVAPGEIGSLRARDVDVANGFVDVGGASARRLTLSEPVRSQLAALLDPSPPVEADRPLVADRAGQALGEADIDTQLACLAHDAGLRHAEAVNARALHFTYAAYLARQGIRMSDLQAILGRMSGEWASALLRLSPPVGLVDPSAVERVYPAFRAV